MNHIKPNNIKYKSIVNLMSDYLFKARKMLMEENDFLDIVQATRIILISCLCFLKFSESEFDENSGIKKIDLLLTENSINQKSWIFEYIGVLQYVGEKVITENSLFYLKSIFQIPRSMELLEYSLEILEYTDDDLEIGKKDRRGGIITVKKKSAGIYYTPNDVVHYMVDSCINNLKIKSKVLSDIMCIDFSSGSGIFLKTLLLRISSELEVRTQKEMCKVLKKSIYGIDISQLAVECSKFLLLLTVSTNTNNNVIDYQEIVSVLNTNIICYDSTNLSTIPESFPRLFDCILGNPPYVSTFQDNSLKGNMFLSFVENMMIFSKETSFSSLVIPLSLTYSTQMPYQLLRSSISKDDATWIFENYDRSPDSLFGDDIKSRNTIVFRISGSIKKKVFSTTLIRWTSKNRNLMIFTPKKYGEVNRKLIQRYIPKLGGLIESEAYSKITENPKSLMDLFHKVDNTKNQIYIKSTCYNWICAYDHMPPSKNLNGKIVWVNSYKVYALSDSNNLYFSIAILNSTVAYWMWSVIGDGFHVTNLLFNELKIHPEMFSNDQYEDLVNKGKQLSKRLIDNPITAINAGKIITTYSPSKAFNLIREIDIIIVSVLNLPNQFELHLWEWYKNQIVCIREK